MMQEEILYFPATDSILRMDNFPEGRLETVGWSCFWGGDTAFLA